jgi:hypothetical protein
VVEIFEHAVENASLNKKETNNNLNCDYGRLNCDCSRRGYWNTLLDIQKNKEQPEMCLRLPMVKLFEMGIFETWHRVISNGMTFQSSFMKTGQFTQNLSEGALLHMWNECTVAIV